MNPYVLIFIAVFFNVSFIAGNKYSFTMADHGALTRHLIIWVFYPIVNYSLAYAFKGDFPIGFGSFIFMGSCTILGALFGYLFFNERLNALTYIAFALIIIGMYLAYLSVNNPNLIK